MVRIFISILTLFYCLVTKGQSTTLDKYTTDTIRLKDFFAKKIVAYKINYVTIYVDYEAYRKELYIFWKRYTDGNKKTKKGEYINPDYKLRYKTIDSVYRLIKKQSQTLDTIYLSQKIFDKAGLRCLMDLDKQIEKGTCAIIDEKNMRHYLIVRKKGSWNRGFLNAWGGRRYFLIGHINFFYEATDWIS